MFYFVHRPHREKSLTITKNNITNYQNKFAVEKQVKVCMYNTKKWRCAFSTPCTKYIKLL